MLNFLLSSTLKTSDLTDACRTFRRTNLKNGMPIYHTREAYKELNNQTQNSDPFIIKQREAEAEAAASVAGDVPPAYYVSSSSAGPSSAVNSAQLQPERQQRPNIPPTNFLVIRRDSASLREAVVIDPNLLLPIHMLNAGTDGESPAHGSDTGNIRLAGAELGGTNLGTRLDASAELELEATPFMGNGSCEGDEAYQLHGRKNLSVECLKGNINLNVWLVDGTETSEDDSESPVNGPSLVSKRRAELDIISKSGNITLDLVSYHCML